MKRVEIVIQEIEKHLELLDYEAEKINNLEIDKMDTFDYEHLMILDAYIFRFIKLQSAMGEKLFPIIFEMLTGKFYTEVSFIDILNTLEKYGFLESGDYWNTIRKLRNEFVHIYPWETDLKVEAIKMALENQEKIKDIFKRIKDYVSERNLQQS
ncbi:MAG: hypothetical protein N2Z81_07580 [Hydrogenothermaceae bacterium]|nr:hypothetical protein [Hydrogenothermaceae bacterium]